MKLKKKGEDECSIHLGFLFYRKRTITILNNFAEKLLHKPITLQAL